MRLTYIISILLLLTTISLASAYNFPNTVVTISYSGNFTNLSELLDTNIVTPTDNYVLTWDSATSMWVPESAAAVGDTNETTRFDTLVGTDCGAGNLVIGIQDDGTVLCAADAGNSSFNQTLTDTLYAVVGAGNSSWNETWANTLYADISVTGGNSSWNETLANTLYYDISNPYSYWNSTFALFNKTYADTLYSAIGTGGNSSWNETLANTLYYDISNPYSYWNSTFALFNKTYADTLYCLLNGCTMAGSIDMGTNDITNVNDVSLTNDLDVGDNAEIHGTLLVDEILNVTGNIYSNGVLIENGNSSWNETYADTLYYGITNPYSYYNSTNPQPGANSSWNETLANTLYYDLGNSYGYYNSTDFSIENYYNNITNFTGTLTDEKICIYDASQQIINCTYTDQTGASGNPKAGDGTYLYNDTNTIYLNETVLNTSIRAIDTVTNTSMKTYVDAEISGVSGGNSSWNETHADTLYYDLGNSYGYWNDTYATFNKTYADTLYASTGTGNSSWNETHADTLYYDLGNSYGYWNSTFALFNKTYADTLYASTGAGNSSWNETYANTIYRLQSWDNITGIPTATPSDGDTTHLSLADEIYDWVIGLGYSLIGFTTDQNNELNTTGSPTFVNVSVETLYGNGDPDTYINWTGATGDQLEIFAGGISFIHLIEGAGDGITFNQDSNDIDWRIETDTLTHGLALDGGTNKVRMENYSSCTYVSTDATGILACETGSIGSDNSSWNETHADTLYYDLGNSYNYWNDTYASFNKTYADTLYAPTGSGNSSWNEAYADTLYADISVVDTDTNLTEDNVEAYIFDDDNTAELNMSGYNITGINHLCMNSDCSSYIWYNGTGIIIQG